MNLSHTLAWVFSLALALPAIAEIRGKAIEYKVGSDTFVGYLAWNDAVATDSTPQPGVVVCPEWWGCNEYAKSRARQLAELGYVAFAIDMYGKESDGKAKTTTDPKQAGEWAGAVMKDPAVLRARASAGMAALTANKMVDTSHVGAIGYCMGGTVAVELARTGANLKAVVTFHASTVSSKTPEDNKKIKATVLVCHGGNDTFVQPGELDAFQKQMKDAGVDYQIATYGGAVHSFTNKDADSFGMDNVKYDAHADRRSWANMRSLFVETLGGENTSDTVVKSSPKPVQDLNK